MNAKPTVPRADYAVEFQGVSKWFGAVLANDVVDLRVRSGKVHAIVGENGAGKSTLMRMLSGAVRPDQGRISVHGKPVQFHRPADALAAGIGMVHQHLSLVPSLNAVENIVLGAEPRTWGFINWGRAREDVQALAEQQGLHIPLSAPVRDLPLAVRQHIEILRAFYRQSSVLILDEPTTILDHKDYVLLRETLRQYVARGGTVLYVSHRLPEIFDLSDDVTVLRQGRVSVTGATSSFTTQSLTEHIVGTLPSRREADRTPRPESKTNTLTIRGLVTRSGARGVALHGVSLDFHGGEIVGIAGVAGNGQLALTRALTGRESLKGGSVTYGSSDWTHQSYRWRRKHGLEWIPADRRAEGLIDGFSIADNLVLNRLGAQPFADHGIRRRSNIVEEAARAVASFGIEPADVSADVATLSGGNQQKVLVARAIQRRPRILVIEQPTRGVDIVTARVIHEQLREVRDTGAVVVIISADLEELLELSDRVAVLYEGRITDVSDRDAVTLQSLMSMLGRTAT